MIDKITKGYVNHYQTIKMTQTLPSGRHVYVTYTKIENKDRWQAAYSTDSAYHICPFDGRFINCPDCGVCSTDKEHEESCVSHKEVISSKEMASRANACAKAPDCTIEFLGY